MAFFLSDCGIYGTMRRQHLEDFCPGELALLSGAPGQHKPHSPAELWRCRSWGFAWSLLLSYDCKKLAAYIKGEGYSSATTSNPSHSSFQRVLFSKAPSETEICPETELSNLREREKCAGKPAGRF